MEAVYETVETQGSEISQNKIQIAKANLLLQENQNPQKQSLLEH
jgi:hypothetical protein